MKVPLSLLLTLAIGLADDVLPRAVANDCTFTNQPEEFLQREARVRRGIFERTKGLRALSTGEVRHAASVPRRNFVDDEIFGQLEKAGVDAAPKATDGEFVRRITLDLTGRLPSSTQVRDFVNDSSPDKRDRLIDALLWSPEFTDRWTMWLGDLLGNSGFNSTTNLQPQAMGRNAFFDWIRSSIADEKNFRDIATEVITGATPMPTTAVPVGHPDLKTNFDSSQGTANFYLFAGTTMGPIQDTYDTALYRTTSAFLGMSHYDCLLCHNGRGHLDLISVWGKNTLRLEAQQMAAFFSRVRTQRQGDLNKANYNSYSVWDNASGTYDLNTTFGNRPNRVAPSKEYLNLTPAYRVTGAKPKDGNWRAAFAANLVQDRMFARNLANRLWKQMFTLALVDPVDTLDPARLDPQNPPADPWALQATHPVLLERLADELTRNGFKLREFLQVLVRSNAYQLSSRYDGDWQLTSVPLFARHYPRRLEGEEVHDAIVAATGVMPKYTVQGWLDTPSWAMQLPEPLEPRSNGGVANFMNTFLRGNRDTVPQRSQAGSIQQQLSLMNDNFVLSRIKVSASPKLQSITKLSSNDAIVEEVYLNFLSRFPTETERSQAVSYLKSTDKTTGVQDLTWACINKMDFLFSY